MTWRNRAACLGGGDVFLLPMMGGRLVIKRKAAAAQAICAQCPVLIGCRTWVRDYWAANGEDPVPWHVAAGMTPAERAEQAPPRPRGARSVSDPRPVATCGTVAGHERHKRNGEEPCRACRDAVNHYQRERLARIKKGDAA